MRVTFVDDLGNALTTVDINPDMDLENVMALLEAESGIPVSEQSISFDGRELTNPKSTMSALGMTDNAMVILRRKVNVAGGRQVPQDAEMLRLQLLGDPAMMRQLQENSPEIAAAAQSNPARFAELVAQISERSRDLDLARQREIELFNADPFDVEAQRRIEEAIRQQAVLENMAHALEWSPEAFGRVTML
ncbi:hypothetical protein BS17DRAFT_504832 [Gyrodon lividus]|nr:hypothetical protein BS17DRAFT_504832 [Gyrodon lividus]